MKLKYSLFISFLFLCLAVGGQASGEELRAGEYTFRAYSLLDGNPLNPKQDDFHDTVTFRNLYIFSSAMDSAFNRDVHFAGSNADKTNFQGLVVKAAYSPTSTITIHSSLGLSNTSDDERIKYGDRLGWEFDLGMAYRFLDNFAYEIHFGYMDTGQLFTESNRYTDIEDITIVTNKITMSF